MQHNFNYYQQIYWAIIQLCYHYCHHRYICIVAQSGPKLRAIASQCFHVLQKLTSGEVAFSNGTATSEERPECKTTKNAGAGLYHSKRWSAVFTSLDLSLAKFNYVKKVPMKKIYLIALLQVFVTASIAQSTQYSAQVLDSENDPVPGATVRGYRNGGLYGDRCQWLFYHQQCKKRFHTLKYRPWG
ncbi:MAG: hypothetical protein U5L96_00905 [Owenweeksia sp.]|nr:hypothetical protein [Owenweeksia sp.]